MRAANLKKCESLINELYQLKPSEKRFADFPFCNEYEFDKTLDVLDEAKPAFEETIRKNPDSLENCHREPRVAICIGESNFLSMLPFIAKYADILIMNDINAKCQETWK